MVGDGAGFRRGRARVFVSGRTETPGHIVMFSQYPCRQVCRTHAHGRELEAPARIFIQGDATGGDLIHGTGNLIDRGGEVAVVHADDRFPGLFDPVHDLLVLDLQLGIALGLLGYTLPDVVVLTGVGSHIGQDGHLVDVGIVFRVDVLEFGMEGGIAGARQAGKSLIDLDEGISFMKVGIVIISWEPAGGGVGDLIGLWSEALPLYKAAEGFCIAEYF